MSRINLLLSLGCLACVTLLAGCVTYHTGDEVTHELRRHGNAWITVVNEPVKTVHRAVEEGLEDLDVEPLVSKADQLTGFVDGLFADGSDFTVTMEAVGAERTKLRIRCGMFGNRRRAERLFTAFEKYL